MGSANNGLPSTARPYPYSTAKPSKKDLLSSVPFDQLGNHEDKNPNVNPSVFPPTNSDMAANTALTIDGSEEDLILRDSEFLTREEVIQRRSRRLKQLSKFYKNHYWALMEELRVKYREYYWKYGKSPFKEEEEKDNGGGGAGSVVEGSGENNGENNNEGKNNRCAFAGCKAKAMALTNYCHSHILSDTKQKLYKACTYVVKRWKKHRSQGMLSMGWQQMTQWNSSYEVTYA
ncbi:INO80 complex subunit D-like [Macadamia integrifolia]|uniref:INO80 complex subunit D-like n=1 Tax=Macadamia integrifolia TaxID=60698 RepID=UPI001C4F23B9|nr:INO80 complex subunit D-like [Macadamia integrifolia]